MIRIRKIRDTRTTANRAAVEDAQKIIRAQFPGLPPEDIDKLPDQLDNPFRYRFVSELLVAEDGQQRVRAVALTLHDPDMLFSYLEFISTAPGARRGSGIGGALYDRVREEAAALGSLGLYFECLPDDPETSPNPEIRKQNAARLKFYEGYGAFPIDGTLYQLPVREGDTDMPFLVFDGLGNNALPAAQQLRRIVRAILERKYADLCPPAYVDRVVGSICDGSFSLRLPRYAKVRAVTAPPDPIPALRGRVPLVMNDRHNIHNIAHDRGYVEAPVRMRVILRELDKTGLFSHITARKFPDRFIREVHEPSLIEYMERACREAPEKTSVYPYVFPIRNPQRRPRERSVLAGYWCIDTFTPLNRNVWPAARQAADCALTAAERVLHGSRLAYALVRPPGHHAERRTFGGFCYLCNCAIAANYLSRFGKVAILDIDYHHGNGQQDIFYERDDVLTVSIHGHPSFAYPYFSGFRDETGRGRGAGYNINLPLPETIEPEQYRETLATALRRIARFEPAFLVLSLGFDTARGDPTGTWLHRAADFRAIGRMIGDAGYATVVVQEGGYRVRTLGTNASNFFAGLVEGAEQARRTGGTGKGPRNHRAASRPRGLLWREAVKREDIESVRALVSGTGMFSSEEIAIAAELVTERIEKGRASGYEFVLAEEEGQLAGYACYGPIPGSETSCDLYWIAVNADRQGRGLGRQILARAESAMARKGALQIYVDTSSSDKYAPTRKFYSANGYAVAAEFADFYRPGDGKVIFVKKLRE